MATEAYGQDFWIGRVLLSKDSREPWRHVVIAEMRGAYAKCHTLLVGESGKMTKRGSWISLKGLAKRWQSCANTECFCKQGREEERTT